VACPPGIRSGLSGHFIALVLRAPVPVDAASLPALSSPLQRKNGVFVLPGFAKFVVVKKPARPAREGINPFTKEKRMFAAKPASKGVRARPVKAVKDAVG
jgi:DNA-binding protein HU-beta